MAKLINRITALPNEYDLRIGAPAAGVSASPVTSYPTHVLGRRGLRTHTAVVSVGILPDAGNWTNKATQPKDAMLRVHPSPAAKGLAIFVHYALIGSVDNPGVINCGTSPGDDDVFSFTLRGSGRYNTGGVLLADGTWHGGVMSSALFAHPPEMAISGLGPVGQAGGLLDVSAMRSQAFWLYFRWWNMAVTRVSAIELPTLEF